CVGASLLAIAECQSLDCQLIHRRTAIASNRASTGHSCKGSAC
ncbi:hypothetical protein, partial [Pseudomonas sp. FEN]